VKYKRTPSSYRTALLRLQVEAEKDANMAHDAGNEKLGRAYFHMAHEIEGCAKSLATVLDRLKRPSGPKRKAKRAKGWFGRLTKV
jgi:hypothetical protein